MLRILVITIFVLIMAGCSKQITEDQFTEEQSKEIVLQFTKAPAYELLSNNDKGYMNAEEFKQFYAESMLPKRHLAPTHEHFITEKYLLDLVSIDVSMVDKKAGVMSFMVKINYPEELGNLSLYFENPKLFDNKKESADNLKKLIMSGQLKKADFEFDEFQREFKFADGGVYLDVKDELDRRNFISEKKIAVGSFLNLLTAVSEYNYPKNHNEFEEVREKIDEVKTALALVNSVLDEIQKTYPDETLTFPDTYSLREFKSKAELVIKLNEFNEEFKGSFVFKNPMVTKSSDGDKGLFFDYKYTGKQKIKEVFYRVNFYDKNGNLFQSLEKFPDIPSIQNVFPGSEDSLGWRMTRNLRVANNAQKVSIELLYMTPQL